MKDFHITTQNLDLTPFAKSTVGFDTLFTELHRQFGNSVPTATGYPPYNIIKNSEDSYEIEVAVAGFAESELNVSAENNVLTIETVAQGTDDGQETEYLYRGIGSRYFSRTFRLGEHIEVSNAALKNGILTVSLVRNVPEEQKPKKIAISSK